MGVPSSEVLELLPQKNPFLFVDKVVSREDKKIHTEFHVTGEEDFFKGHFPGNPIMPGVLLQEALFQTGALLMTGQAEKAGLGMVTRVENVKFKNKVTPGDTLEMHVELKDKLDNAFFMKGIIKVAGKKVALVDFTCMNVEGE